MSINLMQDLGMDVDSEEAAQATKAVASYEQLISSLTQLRKEAGLTQADVAARMETSQSTVSEFENLSSDARFSTIIRYAQAVGAELEITAIAPRRGLAA